MSLEVSWPTKCEEGEEKLSSFATYTAHIGFILHVAGLLSNCERGKGEIPGISLFSLITTSSEIHPRPARPPSEKDQWYTEEPLLFEIIDYH